LEVGISNKPIESPFQIAECVLECFCPIFLLIEALGDGIVFHFVILNPKKNSTDMSPSMLQTNTQYSDLQFDI
jgi:hypothetical protein